ncbi:hypothetical protein GCM10027160_48380 [Streptomyces calidiresistens]|uniref:DUF6895 domain-containing protein n=1 Tax=Streptomyces calidiresistens TaxID=1485586 RepID=A0A7W3T0V5_9ACTN|nr:hypothetical protein [Streptomyces calidiresistens]MBB0228826.1 hypothetical protein [Streptomyces calidiresistens]
MNTHAAAPDRTATRLFAGAQRWIRRHAGYLDSPAGREELPLTPRVKALMQLALLRHCWARTVPADDPGLEEVTAVVERAWRRPGFPHADSLDPRYARQLRLMYAALAPDPTGPHRAVLDRLTAEGYLEPRRKPPYLHLETRCYADLAGSAHRLASYRELYARSLLARATGLPVAELDVCEITHTVFHLTGFGFRESCLTGEERRDAARVVARLTDHCVRGGQWDFAAKLLLARHCLDGEPLRTPSGRAVVRLLAGAQSPDGAIPGKSVAERAAPTATPVEFFRASYQATIATALATLSVTGGRGPGTDVPTTPAERETR